jgi:cobalt/nickel transport protein
MSAAGGAGVAPVKLFDRFTRTMLIIMLGLLLVVFVSAKIMSHEHMTGAGTDDKVNALAESAAHKTGHPFLELPGDSQVAAFSIANFFVGIILGYSIQRLFVKREGMEPGTAARQEGMEPEGGAAG